MKAFWIKVTEQTVAEIEYTALADVQRMIGGYLEIAKKWPTGDVLYVDEDGLRKQPRCFFRVPGNPDLIGSNGVVVGREIDDTADTADPVITLDQLTAEIAFYTITRNH